MLIMRSLLIALVAALALPQTLTDESAAKDTNDKQKKSGRISDENDTEMTAESSKLKRALPSLFRYGYDGEFGGQGSWVGNGHYHKHGINLVTNKITVPVTFDKYFPFLVEEKIPVPVEIEKKVSVYIEKPVPYPIDRPIHINKYIPVPVEKKVPYPVTIEKKIPIPYPVEKPIPYPVHVEKKVHVPYRIEKLIPYPVEKKIPYTVQIEKKVPVPVPYPVTIEKKVPIPYPVEKPVPYPVQIEKKIPVPYLVPIKKEVPIYIPFHASKEERGRQGIHQGEDNQNANHHSAIERQHFRQTDAHDKRVPQIVESEEYRELMEQEDAQSEGFQYRNGEDQFRRGGDQNQNESEKKEKYQKIDGRTHFKRKSDSS